MFIALALLAATPTEAAGTPQQADDPIICHREESDVGTHMRPKPVCMKKSEWDFAQRNTQKQLQNFREHSSFDPGSSPTPR
jgi:hypothetical protein